MSQKDKAAKEQLRRQRNHEKACLLALAEAEQLERDAARRERLDEIAAPAIMRQPVLAANGRMLLGPRVEVVDGRPAHVDSVTALKLTERQKRAGRQLLADWREVGTGINARAVDYLHSSGAGDGLGAHAAIRRQIDTRARLDGALTYLGAFAPLVARVVLDCVPLRVWACQAGRTVESARGWLAAALDRAALFYWPIVLDRPIRERILTIGPARADYEMGIDTDATNVVAESVIVTEV